MRTREKLAAELRKVAAIASSENADKYEAFAKRAETDEFDDYADTYVCPITQLHYKTGDWVVFDLYVGQIKELRGDGHAIFSDGFCETSGRLVDRFRPLTLKNKRITETFDIYYNRLREIGGEVGFNYPDISRYFSQLALDAIDGSDDAKEPYEKALKFVTAAKNYTSSIDGIDLFRRNLSKCAV